MDLERLSEFVTITQCGSLKKAAFELDVSVATLSARLLRFEDHLGTPLFIRTGTSMELTDSGKRLLPSAKEILAHYGHIRQDMIHAQVHSYNKLRIAITGTGLPLHLGPFLDQLILKHPEMHLDLLDDSRCSIEQGLLSGETDLYFAPVCDDYAPQSLTQQLIARPGEYVLLPRTHRLADRSMLSIRELDGETFILYPRTAESSIRDFQIHNLQDSGIHYSLYESETSVLFSRLLVPIGKGIILYPHMMDLPPNSVCIPVTDLPHHASVCFYYTKANPNPDVQAFVNDYLEYTKEMTRFEHK